jgi:energy-coupling factor transporter transmembrane protein EcfT
VDFERNEANDESGRRPRLGSLTQAVRSKQLKTARTILFFVGGYFILLILYFWLTFDKQAEEAAKQEGIPPWQIAEYKDAVKQGFYVVTGVFAALSILYFVLGALAKRHPVGVSITGLVVFLAWWAIMAALDRRNIYMGLLIKIIVIVGLAKAIQAAIAYRREQEAAQGMPIVPEEVEEDSLRRPEPTDW